MGSSILRTAAVLTCASVPASAQWCVDFRAEQGANDVLQPLAISTTSSVDITHCLTIPLLTYALPATLPYKLLRTAG